MPIFYECDRCTNCCRWPGEVKLGDQEIEEIAQFLKLTPDGFIQKYTRLRADRKGLALTDKPNDECIFLKNGCCEIQAVKPQQCRGFPNVWNFPGFQQVCQAKAHEVSEKEYQERIAQSLAPKIFKEQGPSES